MALARVRCHPSSSAGPRDRRQAYLGDERHLVQCEPGLAGSSELGRLTSRFEQLLPADRERLSQEVSPEAGGSEIQQRQPLRLVLSASHGAAQVDRPARLRVANAAQLIP